MAESSSCGTAWPEKSETGTISSVLLLKFFLKTSVYVNGYVHLSANAPWRPWLALDPGAGVPGGCGHPDIGASIRMLILHRRRAHPEPVSHLLVPQGSSLQSDLVAGGV